MRIDLTNGESLQIIGESLLLGNEYSHNENDSIFLEDAESVSNGELMDKVRKLEKELVETVAGLKAIAMSEV